MYKKKRHVSSLARQFNSMVRIFTLLGIAAPALADQLPDAGRLLREQPKAPPALPAKPLPPIKPQAPEQAPQDDGAKVLVKGFRIEGATRIPVEELQAKIAPAVGRELNFLELRAVAEALVAYYAEKGYLARAVLPQQDVESGIILIQIIEGVRGNLQINNNGKHARSDRVQGFVDYRLKQGEPMNLEALGEAVNLLNEQPGVDVKSTLKPGAETGVTDLIVTVTESKPMVVLNFGLSNNGSRGTGEGQAVAGVTLLNPTGLFDQASLLFTKSEGSKFGSGEYSLAVGNSGLRVGASASRMLYKVTQDSLSASDAHGTATTFGLKAEYPLYRRTDFGLTLTGNLDNKKLLDNTVAGNTGDRRVNTATLGINGNRQDTFGGGGATIFGLGYVIGDSDENNQAAIATDAASRNALGSFGKLRYNLERQQKLTASWMLSANLRGQLAFDNLDSSERFSLGGSEGVRAYPTGEAGGDDGWLFSLNLVRSFSDALQGTLFLDTGRIHVNHDTWAGWNAGNPNLDNRYQLSGAGARVDWRLNEGFALSGTLVMPIGSNPGHDTNGKDADGRDRDVRAWVNLVGQF